jgi:hypothetical protein
LPFSLSELLLRELLVAENPSVRLPGGKLVGRHYLVSGHIEVFAAVLKVVALL